MQTLTLGSVIVSRPEAKIKAAFAPTKTTGGQRAHLLLEGPQEETSRSPSLLVFCSLPLSLVFFLSSPLFLSLSLTSLSRRLARPMSLLSRGQNRGQLPRYHTLICIGFLYFILPKRNPPPRIKIYTTTSTQEREALTSAAYSAKTLSPEKTRRLPHREPTLNFKSIPQALLRAQ